MDLTKARSIVYRKDENKMIYMDEQEEYLNNGWFDSPAKVDLQAEPAGEADIAYGDMPVKKEPENNWLSREEMKKILDDAGVKYFPNAKNEKLKKLVADVNSSENT